MINKEERKGGRARRRKERKNDGERLALRSFPHALPPPTHTHTHTHAHTSNCTYTAFLCCLPSKHASINIPNTFKHKPLVLLMKIAEIIDMNK